MTGKSQREPAGFAPASPPAAVPRPQEWHIKQTAWFLKPEGLEMFVLFSSVLPIFRSIPFELLLLPFLDLKHNLAQRLLCRNFSPLLPVLSGHTKPPFSGSAAREEALLRPCPGAGGHRAVRVAASSQDPALQQPKRGAPAASGGAERQPPNPLSGRQGPT